MSRIINGIEYGEYDPSLPKRTRTYSEEEMQIQLEKSIKIAKEIAKQIEERRNGGAS